jgi:hypothetical protein
MINNFSPSVPTLWVSSPVSNDPCLQIFNWNTHVIAGLPTRRVPSGLYRNNLLHSSALHSEKVPQISKQSYFYHFHNIWFTLILFFGRYAVSLWAMLPISRRYILPSSSESTWRGRMYRRNFSNIAQNHTVSQPKSTININSKKFSSLAAGECLSLVSNYYDPEAYLT